MERVINLSGREMDIMVLTHKGYCCSQVMAILMLREMGRENPDLVRAMGGLCYGIGYSGEMCGALSGGACLISLVAGKGGDGESPEGEMPLMLSELVDWFREKVQGPYGTAKCDDILGSNADKRPCMALIAETYDKAMSILEAHGIGPAAA